MAKSHKLIRKGKKEQALHRSDEGPAPFYHYI